MHNSILKPFMREIDFRQKRELEYFHTAPIICKF